MIFIVGIVFLITLFFALAEAYYERDFPRRTIIFLLVMAVAMLFTVGANAQNTRFDYSAYTVTGVGNLLPVLAIPGASVRFYTGCTALPCSTYASVYNSSSSTTACANTAQIVLNGTSSCVSVADNEGNFGGWFLPGEYQYTIAVFGTTYGPYSFTPGLNSGSTPARATSLAGGALGSAPYQSGPNATAFIPSPTTTGTYLYAWQPTGSSVLPTAVSLTSLGIPSLSITILQTFLGPIAAPSVNAVYSIVGNGSTDNTSAIQADVSACAAGTTCTITLNSSIVISSTVTLPTTSNFNFIGTGSVSCTGSALNCFQRTLSSGEEFYRVSFSGLTFTKANAGAVIADLESFNSAGNEGMTIIANNFTLSGGAIGIEVQGVSNNFYTNDNFTSPSPFSDHTGIAIQPQSGGTYGPQTTMVTGCSFYELTALNPTFTSGQADSFEGWQFTGNNFGQAPIFIQYGVDISFNGNQISGSAITVKGSLFGFNFQNNYADDNGGATGSAIITFNDTQGPINDVLIQGNYLQQSYGANQHGFVFNGPGTNGMTGITITGNNYSASAVAGITSMSATTTVVTVVTSLNPIVGELVGVNNLSTQPIPNGTVLTVLTSSGTQFTASYSSAGFSSTALTGFAYNVAYGIWFNNPGVRNVMIGHENFRLEWYPINITNTLAFSVIDPFTARDSGNVAINGLGSYFNSSNNDSLLYQAQNGHYIFGNTITDCGQSLCVTGGATSDTITSSSSRGGNFICTSGGTITISNALVDGSSDVLITLGSPNGGTITTPPAIATITSGAGFTAKCATLDTGIYRYRIWN